MKLDDWDKYVGSAFPDHLKKDRRSWLAAITGIELGDEVSGRIVARAPFGIWIDIGVGYPALLEIIMIKDFDREQYFGGNDYPVGTEINATVRGFGEEDQQIYLEQFPFDNYIREKRRGG
jgi:ribosomal protein S1